VDPLTRVVAVLVEGRVSFRRLWRPLFEPNCDYPIRQSLPLIASHSLPE